MTLVDMFIGICNAFLQHLLISDPHS